MPRYVIVRTAVQSLVNQTAPLAEEIANAFREGGTGIPVVAAHGTWVGPRPRVTRVPAVVAPTTRAVWLFRWDDSAQVAAFHSLYDQLLAGNVGDRLTAQTRSDIVPLNWTPPIVEVYSPALHGELAWWESGRSASTRTQDEFPSLLSMDPSEAPGGETPPSSSAVDTLMSVLKVAAWVAVPAAVLGVVYYAGPVVQRLTWTDPVSENARARRELAASTRTASLAVRGNPRRRRTRRP